MPSERTFEKIILDKKNPVKLNLRKDFDIIAGLLQIETKDEDIGTLKEKSSELLSAYRAYLTKKNIRPHFKSEPVIPNNIRI